MQVTLPANPRSPLQCDGAHYVGQPVLSPSGLGCAKFGEGNLCDGILIRLHIGDEVRETPRQSAIEAKDGRRPSASSACAASKKARYPASRARNIMIGRCRMKASACGSA
ncbi:hypothetical protein V1282_005918 [Nitrobacteraceae bacterium AZCC 2146]